MYGFSALLQNEMHGLKLSCDASELVGPGRGVCPVSIGDEVVTRMGMDTRSKYANIGCLLALIGAFRALAYLALRRRYSYRRLRAGG